jgi:hydrogenase expression/formation protein HypC
MCLAVPARILQIDQIADTAIVSLGGLRKPVSLALLDAAAVGDYVLVHVGYALNRISPAEAERTLGLMRQAGGLDTPELPGNTEVETQAAIQAETQAETQAEKDNDSSIAPIREHQR